MSSVDWSTTAAEVVEGHDVRGREVVVTGGTSGIGWHTAVALARAGARVVVTGRDRAKGREAAARAGTGVEFRHLDLARLASVTQFARDYGAAGRPLHVLIANAGTLTPTLSRTEDGFEAHFGVNHLGHHALTTGLLPALRAAGGARVVVLSSRAHRRGDVDFDDPNYRIRAYNPWQAYGASKTANALFAVGLTARFADDGITANAVMPGMVMTELARHLSQAELTALGWDRAADADDAPLPGWKTAPQAAATPTWAAVAPELDGIGGLYLEDCAVGRPWPESANLPVGHYRPYALDPERAEQLWHLSERLTNR